ncbi:MAG TPA: glycosyltransferase, partial [Candidatus Paceibacterota bacterium]
SNYEGYGRTVIEAFAAGCPVVMTDVGIAGEIVVDQKNGLVVPVGDVLALTQALVIVYKDEAFRKTFIELRDKARYIKNYHDAVEKLIH